MDESTANGDSVGNYKVQDKPTNATGKRRATLKRKSRIVEADDTHPLSEVSSASNREARIYCPLMGEDITEEPSDAEGVSYTTRHLSSDKEPSINGEFFVANGRETFDGINEQTQAFEIQSLHHTFRMSSDDPEKQNSIVTSGSSGEGPHHVGDCSNRRLSNKNRGVPSLDDREEDMVQSDKCNQYIELCKSFLKPCCCCNDNREEEHQFQERRRVTLRGIIKNEEDFLIPEDPFRKRCLRACMTFVYILLVGVGGVVTYSMIADLVTSMQNPVRSIHYNKVTDYEAPGIAVYPGGAEFLACGHYYNNVVTSKVRLGDLDLVNRNCSFEPMKYTDPHYPDVERDVLLVRGPTSFTHREAIFLHFALEDESRDFFTVSYFVFPEFDQFNASSNRVEQLLKYHSYMPTFALSAGLRMWIKLIMSEAYFMDDSKHTEFKVEYSVVKFVDRRPEDERKRHLFFIFFEWKNDIIEQSHLLYTTTPWSIGAGLCGVFLTLHRVYQLAQTSYRRVQKDKQRRSIRKRTLRELRQKSMTEQR